MQKLVVVLYVLFTAFGLILMKLGSSAGAPLSITDGKLHANLNWTVLSGLVLYGLSFISYLYLISKFELGYIVPLTTAAVYILVFTASFLVFKEAFTSLKVAGIGLIVLGLALLNLGR